MGLWFSGCLGWGGEALGLDGLKGSKGYQVGFGDACIERGARKLVLRESSAVRGARHGDLLKTIST